MNTQTAVLSREEREQRSFITKVYGWMTFALTITGTTSYYVYQNPAIISTLSSNVYILMAIFIGELIIVGTLSLLIKKMSVFIAIVIFILYSLLNGLTFSLLFLLFTKESIAIAFFITAGIFGAMSLYGFTTKKNLTGIGALSMMSIIGFIIASIVNYFFFPNKTFYWIVSFIGVIAFVGLTAYDTQKIKELNIIGNEGTDEDKKEAIMGALTLYLDFVNLFLLILRFTGRKDSEE